jgi:hypothetical protein
MASAASVPPPAEPNNVVPTLLNPVAFKLVVEELSPNEQALLLRPLCKEAKELLPDATVVHLSQPVPEFAFAQKWGQPDSCKHLSYSQCEELLCLTAKSGVVANMRLLAVGPRGPEEVGAAGVSLTSKVFAAAAGAGQLPTLHLLKDLGCPFDCEVLRAAVTAGQEAAFTFLAAAGCPGDSEVLGAAARAGQERMAEVLVSTDTYLWSWNAAGSAAAAGHVSLMRRLLHMSAQDPGARPTEWDALLTRAAYGLDLTAFQASPGGGWVCRGRIVRHAEATAGRLSPNPHQEVYAKHGADGVAERLGPRLLACAAASPCEDWRAKASCWLCKPQESGPIWLLTCSTIRRSIALLLSAHRPSCSCPCIQPLHTWAPQVDFLLAQGHLPSSPVEWLQDDRSVSAHQR